VVRSPLTAARATFALKAGEWFRRGRLLMVSPVHGDYRRHQAEIPLIALSKFPRPALLMSQRLASRHQIKRLTPRQITSRLSLPTTTERAGHSSRFPKVGMHPFE